MKRKLFVILALAAVIMALCCSAALADAPAFTSQPVGGTIVPDGGRIIRWKTNFTPQKVVLGYSSYHDNGFPGGSGWTFIPQKTIESSLQSDMQTTLTYSLAVTSEKWSVRAYYSDTQFAESSFFPIDVVSRQFTVSPAGGTISPDGFLNLNWETNFKPTQVEIGYETTTTTSFFGTTTSTVFHKATTLTTGLKKSMSYPLPYQDAVESNRWIIRASYADGKSVDSRAFTVTPVGRAFTVQPAGGATAVQETFDVTWELNFTPVRQALVRKWSVTTTGWFNQTTTTEHESEIAEIGSALRQYSCSEYEGIVIRAYYSADGYLDSQKFSVSEAEGTFIQQPQSALASGSETCSVAWQTDFTPSMIEFIQLGVNSAQTVLGTWEGSQAAVRSGSYPFPTAHGDDVNGKYLIRATYASSSNQVKTVSSDPFYVGSTTADYRFTTQPGDCYAVSINWSSVTWAVNFQPEKVEYLRGTGTDVSQYSTTPYLSYSDTYNYAIRCYYSVANGLYCTSNPFTVTYYQDAWTKQPEGGSYVAGTKFHLTWELQFTPVTIILRYCTPEGHPITQVPQFPMDPAKSYYDMEIESGNPTQYYYIWAWLDDNHYVVSDPFRVQKLEEYIFVQEPQDIVIPENDSGSLTWVTGFSPRKTEVLEFAIGDPDHAVSCTELADPKQNTFEVTTDGTNRVRAFVVRAWYGATAYVDSSPAIATQELIERIFTQQPEDGSIPVSGEYSLTWMTNFIPVRTEIWRGGYTEGQVTDPTLYLTTDNPMAGTCQLENDRPGTLTGYEVRAYYTDTGYIGSNAVGIYHERNYLFVRQPRDGHIFPGDETVTVSWEVDFTPVRTEIILNGQVMETLDADVMAFDFGESEDEYLVRVYYDEISYIESDSFTVKVHWNHSGTLSNGMTWRLAVSMAENDSNVMRRGLLRIDGAGAMPHFSDARMSPWDRILSNMYSYSVSNNGVSKYAVLHIQLDDRITAIGNYSFNSSLTQSVHFPSSLTRIGDCAFMGSGLIEVDSFPDGLQTIGISAFDGCISLMRDDTLYYNKNYGRLFIPDSVTSIGAFAFRYAPIQELYLPHSLSRISDQCFAENKYLERVYLPNDLAAIDEYAFCNSANNYSSGLAFALSITPYNQEREGGVVKFPDTLRSLGKGAFERCYHIRSLILPEGLTEIPESCFEGCGELTSITLPETLTRIGDYAFTKYYPGRSVSRIPEITIPRSVTAIGEYALGYKQPGSLSSYVHGITIRGYTGTEAEAYILRQNNAAFIFEPLDTESLTLYGFINGSACGGENAEATGYQFSETETSGTYTLDFRFSTESFIGLRRDIDDKDSSRIEWYSAASPAETSAVLTNRGATSETASLLAVPAGPGRLTLTDNGDGSYTLSYEAVISTGFISGSVTGWAEVEMTANDGMFTYSAEIDPSTSWSGSFEVCFIIDDAEYTASATIFDTVTGLVLEPRENEDGDYNYDNIILAVSAPATYTFTVDPIALMLTVTNDLEKPGAFLIGFRGNYPQRMIDLSSGETGMTEEGGEGERPINPYVFPGGTTLWASAYVSPDNEGNFYIGCNGQTWGTASVNEETVMTLNQDGRCPIWVNENFDGAEFDFYYCPETHQMMIQKHISTHQLTLYTWNTAEERPMSEVTDYYENDTDKFTIAPESAIHYKEEWDETPFVPDGETIVITAPDYPGYHVAAWYPCTVSMWWSSDSTGFDLNLYGDEPSLGSGTTLVYTVEDVYGEIQLTAVYEVGEAESVTVTFDSQGGSEVASQTLENGETAAEPAAPLKIGAMFTGWYTDASCAAETQYSFDTPVTADLTLYAGWVIPEPAGCLKLPSSLTEIEDEAFAGSAAEAVVIPETMTAITGNPFAGSNVQYVYGFPGTEAQTFTVNYPVYTFVPIDADWLANHE